MAFIDALRVSGVSGLAELRYHHIFISNNSVYLFIEKLPAADWRFLPLHFGGGFSLYLGFNLLTVSVDSIQFVLKEPFKN